MNAATPAQVWILMQGEHYEGGHVLGIFATRELAKGEFVRTLQRLAFAIDDAQEDEDGSLHVDAGCDWVSLTPHDLVQQIELSSSS